MKKLIEKIRREATKCRENIQGTHTYSFSRFFKYLESPENQQKLSIVTRFSATAVL